MLWKILNGVLVLGPHFWDPGWGGQCLTPPPQGPGEEADTTLQVEGKWEYHPDSLQKESRSFYENVTR